MVRVVQMRLSYQIGAIKIIEIIMFSFLLLSCSSAEIAENSETVLEQPDTADKAPLPPPVYEKLMKRLGELGYEGIGLQHESEEILSILLSVFTDKSLSNRQIKTIYTGIHMGFEPKHKSLTIGGTSSVETIREYIRKNVPLK